MNLSFEAFKQSVSHLYSGEFTEGVQKKNLPHSIVQATQGLLSSPDMLQDYATQLAERSNFALQDFFGEGNGKIIIPFSGGRDSTSIALLTLMHPALENRSVQLVSALPGYSRGLDNPRKQAQLIQQRLQQLGIERPFDPELDHIYLDISTAARRTVLESAEKDLQRLGYAGFCSSCKITMEAGIVAYAAQYEAAAVAMGYTDVQAQQQWPEQSVVQQLAMQEYLEKKYPNVQLGSPLFDIIQTPIDTTLLLGIMGLPPENHKCEMKCAAGGTNPREIHEPTLLKHVQEKQIEVSALVGSIHVSEGVNPDNSFVREIEDLKNSPQFKGTVYISK